VHAAAAPATSPPAHCFQYVRREPEKTTLYRILQEPLTLSSKCGLSTTIEAAERLPSTFEGCV
jgi:hypothetical protein